MQQNTGFITATIQELGAQGDGIALGPQGETVFVAGALPGEIIECRLVGKRGDGWVGEIVSVKRRNPDRRDALCRHFGICGGCQVQHLAEGFYLAWKRDLLVEAFGKSKIVATEIDVFAVPPGSRRRARFAAIKVGKSLRLGFHQRRGDTVVDIDTCPVLVPKLVETLPALRRLFMTELADGQEGDALIAILDDGAIDLVLTLPGRADLPLRQRLIKAATEAGWARVSLRPRPESEPETLATIRPVTLAIASQVVAPPPGAFFQAVREAETRLTDIVTRALEGARRVVDLYAGCGTFSLALVGRGRLVAAFEGDEQAVAALAQAFKRQPFPATVTRRDLAKRPLGTADLDEVDAVVLDPPHAGARAQCRALARSSARTIAYVSCNPATLARDLEFLIAGGYRLEALTLVDQFLWSAQIEAVAILRRKGKVVL